MINEEQSKTKEIGKLNKEKQKNHSRKLLRRNLSSNRPSCKNDAAKIQINRKTAIQKLTELEKKYSGTDQIYGFLTNVKSVIGLRI